MMPLNRLPKSTDQDIDDQTASLTDHILSGDKGDLKETDRAEVDNLRSTILRVRNATRSQDWTDLPDAGMVARIRSRLRKEWDQLQQQPRQKAWACPRLALAGSLAVILLVTIFILSNPTTQALPGTASESSLWLPLVGIVGLILIGLLIWIDRHR